MKTENIHILLDSIDERTEIIENIVRTISIANDPDTKAYLTKSILIELRNIVEELSDIRKLVNQ